MSTSAIFIVPNNQSQEFLVTKAREDGFPEVIFQDIGNYNTELKARALCRIKEFENLEKTIEEIEILPDGCKHQKIKFSYGFSGLRTLLKRKEFDNQDYYYLFTKGRWLWSDNADAIIAFVKDGSLTMADSFVQLFENDFLDYVREGQVENEIDSPELNAYKKVFSEKAFVEYFHNKLKDYNSYFEKSQLCFFYKPWIIKNERGVASSIRFNILKTLKRIKRMKETMEPRKNRAVEEDENVEGECPTCGCRTIDGWTTEELDYTYPHCPDCGSSLMDGEEVINGSIVSKETSNRVKSGN